MHDIAHYLILLVEDFHQYHILNIDKKITNNNIIESKNNETASIKSIYLDENTKTIYVIAIGGN